MKIEHRVLVAATPVEAFTKLSDVKLLCSLFTGLFDWYPTDSPNRFRSVVRAGPAPLGGEVELEFWPESGAVTWHSTKGVHQMGRFLVRKKEVGSEITLRIYYHLDGGVFSRLAEALAALTVHRFVVEVLERVRRSIEAMPPKPRRSPRRVSLA